MAGVLCVKRAVQTGPDFLSILSGTLLVLSNYFLLTFYTGGYFLSELINFINFNNFINFINFLNGF